MADYAMTAAVGSRGTTDDAFLGGGLVLRQPEKGYRAGLDAVLLAASARVEAGDRVLDAGAGVGTVGLCVAWRVRGAAVTLVERAPELAALARHNVAVNGFSDRVRVVEADVTDVRRRPAAAELAPEGFEHVLANPPYHEEGRGRRSKDALKAGSHEMARGGLEAWARFLARMAAPAGRLALIHRADALGELLVAFEGRFGALVVLPVHPRAGEPAHRVLLTGRKGSKAPLTVLPGLILHGEGNRFLPTIEAVLREGKSLML